MKFPSIRVAAAIKKKNKCFTIRIKRDRTMEFVYRNYPLKQLKEENIPLFPTNTEGDMNSAKINNECDCGRKSKNRDEFVSSYNASFSSELGPQSVKGVLDVIKKSRFEWYETLKKLCLEWLNPGGDVG